MKKQLLIGICFIGLFFWGCTNDAPADKPNDPIQLDITPGVSNIENIISVMGNEPDSYVWDDQTFTRETLPDEKVIMWYKNGDELSNGFLMINNGSDWILYEMRIHNQDSYCSNGLVIGDTLERSIDILGEPENIVDDGSVAYVKGTLYKNINNVIGYHYYDTIDLGTRLFYSENKITSIFIYGNSSLKIMKK